MKPTSVLINVARGGNGEANMRIKNEDFDFPHVGIIVQADLIEALQNGTIFAAGLDVMDPEPLTQDHPLTKLPNCGKNNFAYRNKI